MSRLIKKYKNRRLYDTEISQYIKMDKLQDYVVKGIDFRVEDSETNLDITNTVLLQILVEMESGPNQFLSSDLLRQIIIFANHPMHSSLKNMMEQMIVAMEKPLQSNPYKEASEAWNKQMQDMMKNWQGLFK